MSNSLNPTTGPGQPMVYQIRIKGRLGPQWTDWFEGMDITPVHNGDTLLTGPVVDQAALHGLLKKVRDLGLPLLSVMVVTSGQARAQDVPQPGTPGSHERNSADNNASRLFQPMNPLNATQRKDTE